MPEKYEDTRKAVLDLTEKLDSFLIAFQGQTHDDSVQRHEMVVELRQIKAEVTQIKQIVVGVDGGNGLRLEVREIARRVGTVEKDLERALVAEEKRNQFAMDWGWKVVAFVIGLVMALPGLIKTLIDVFAKSK